MKRKILPILLAFPVLLSGCAGIKKAFHPVDWFKTEVLKIEDTTIDAQDLAEMPSKFKNFSADFHIWTEVPEHITNQTHVGYESYSTYKQTTRENGLRILYEEEFTPNELRISKLDLLQSFSTNYPNVTPSEDLLDAYIRSKYPGSTYVIDDLTYIIKYKTIGNHSTFYEISSGAFSINPDAFAGQNVVELEFAMIMDSASPVCSVAYPLLHYEKEGKYYSVGGETAQTIFSHFTGLTLTLKVYFVDNLIRKIEGTVSDDSNLECFTIDVYDIGTTVIV